MPIIQETVTINDFHVKGPFMKLNTIIKIPDGRIGTICYNNLDGRGGVWGKHEFQMPLNGFGDELPEPEFMLRKPELKELFGVECVGEEYEIIPA